MLISLFLQQILSNRVRTLFSLRINSCLAISFTCYGCFIEFLMTSVIICAKLLAGVKRKTILFLIRMFMMNVVTNLFIACQLRI